MAKKPKKNPRKSVQRHPIAYDVQLRTQPPAQRTFFHFHPTYPGHASFPKHASKGRSVDLAITGTENFGQDDPFVYEPVDLYEYPEPGSGRSSKDISSQIPSTYPGTGQGHSVRQKTLGFGGPDEGGETQRGDDLDLVDELDMLGDMFIKSLNAWVMQKFEESKVTRRNPYTEMFETYFDEFLTQEGSDQEIVNIIESLSGEHRRLVQRCEDNGHDADLAAIGRDRSNWNFEMGESSDASSWEHTDYEVQVTDDFEDIVTTSDDYNDLEEVLDRVQAIFTELEGGDAEAAEIAVKMFLKNIQRHSDVSNIDPAYSKNVTAYISVTAHAKMDEVGVAQDLERLLENDDDDADEDEAEAGDEDASEQDVVKGRVAKISDDTQLLPFEVDYDSDATRGWTVWNLSAEDLRNEGKAQSHCVGDGGMGYADAIADGACYIWSVKDANSKSKFTIQVERQKDFFHRGEIRSFTQIKGKGNRLPGWAFKRDYDPYVSPAYHPRLTPVVSRDGKILQPKLSADEVRVDEVLWLWALIKAAVPDIAELYAFRQEWWATTKFQSWEAVERAMKGEHTLADIEPPADEAGPSDAVYTLQQFCQDMLPGLVAVWTGKLFNGPAEDDVDDADDVDDVDDAGLTDVMRAVETRGRENPRYNPGYSGETIEADLEPRSFDVPYVRSSTRASTRANTRQKRTKKRQRR